MLLDVLRGPVTSLNLGSGGWETHPAQVRVRGRVIPLRFFATQPTELITAFCGSGERIDLVVVAPGAGKASGAAAMAIAATGNHVTTPFIPGARVPPPRSWTRGLPPARVPVAAGAGPQAAATTITTVLQASGEAAGTAGTVQ